MQIIILVGLKGAGKTTLANLLAAKGWPTIEPGDDPLTQIQNLEAAGQKQVALDGIALENFRRIYQAYPDETLVIGVVVPKALRRDRLVADPAKNLSDAEIQECDRIELEELHLGRLLASADFYILNDASLAQLETKLDAVLNATAN